MIDAVQLTVSSIKEVYEFVHGKTDTASRQWYDYCSIVAEEGLTIQTLEGNHLARMGDYIIKGVKGEFYPCKPDIFEMTYEKV